MTFKLLISLLFLLPVNSDKFSAKREKYTHEIVKNFAIKLQKKGIRPVGLGEGIDHDSGKQNYLKLVSNVPKLPNIEFARQLIVETIREFLMEINSNAKVQPYLAESPFTINYITIGILSEESKNGLTAVSNYKNKISYSINNPDPFGKAWIEIHEETFEEAEKILFEQKKY